MPTFSVQALAAEVKGELVGSADCTITTVCSLEEPSKTGLAFSRDETPFKLKKLVEGFSVGAILLTNKVDRALLTSGTFILVSDPLAALIRLIPKFFPNKKHPAGVHALASVDPSATIAPSASIGAFVVIGANSVIEDGVVIHPHVTIYPDVKIGRDSEIHSGASIREGTVLGARSIIQNGAVVGSDGFGYIPGRDSQGRPVIVKVPQVGTAVLSEGVEVGANACVDRATLGTTVVGRESKIDNLVQVGHNVKIGECSILCGQVGIGGSAKIGNFVTLGGNSGVADHISIVDNVRVGAKSAVISDIDESGDYAGIPAINAFKWRKVMHIVSELPERFHALRKLSQDHVDKSEKK